jgi:hypothetical protein
VAGRTHRPPASDVGGFQGRPVEPSAAEGRFLDRRIDEIADL